MTKQPRRESQLRIIPSISREAGENTVVDARRAPSVFPEGSHHARNREPVPSLKNKPVEPAPNVIPLVKPRAIAAIAADNPQAVVVVQRAPADLGEVTQARDPFLTNVPRRPQPIATKVVAPTNANPGATLPMLAQPSTNPKAATPVVTGPSHSGAASGPTPNAWPVAAQPAPKRSTRSTSQGPATA